MKHNARTRFEKKSIDGLGGESPPTRTGRELRQRKKVLFSSISKIHVFLSEGATRKS